MPEAEASHISFDLPCSACGYNLRGLQPTGTCPECGSPARNSLDGRAARPTWLHTVRRGTMLLGAAMALGVICVAIALAKNNFKMLWLLPLSAILGAAGTWQFAANGPDRRRRLGTFLRVAGLVTCGMQLQLVFTVVAATGGAPGVIDLRRAIYPLLLTWSATAAVTCWRAASVAGEVGDRSGVIQGGLLALLAPAVLLGAAGPIEAMLVGNTSLDPLFAWGACAFAVAGWCAVYFTGFTIILSRAANVAA